MYILKYKKKNSKIERYIWAEKTNLNEWCISLNPCLFEKYDDAKQLLNIVKNTNKSDMILFIEEMN